MGKKPTTVDLCKASLDKAMNESSLAILLLCLGCLGSIVPVSVQGSPCLKDDDPAAERVAKENAEDDAEKGEDEGEAEGDGEEEEEGEDEDAEEEEEEGCVIEEETLYMGHDIKGKGNVKVENQQACATLAGTIEGALFWTYRPSDKKCFIKNSKKGKRRTKGVCQEI